MSAANGRKLIEIDKMTGAERDITWLHDDLEAGVAWREKNISGRYGYRIDEA